MFKLKTHIRIRVLENSDPVVSILQYWNDQAQVWQGTAGKIIPRQAVLRAEEVNLPFLITDHGYILLLTSKLCIDKKIVRIMNLTFLPLHRQCIDLPVISSGSHPVSMRTVICHEYFQIYHFGTSMLFLQLTDSDLPGDSHSMLCCGTEFDGRECSESTSGELCLSCDWNNHCGKMITPHAYLGPIPAGELGMTDC